MAWGHKEREVAPTPLARQLMSPKAEEARRLLCRDAATPQDQYTPPPTPFLDIPGHVLRPGPTGTEGEDRGSPCPQGTTFQKGDKHRRNTHVSENAYVLAHVTVVQTEKGRLFPARAGRPAEHLGAKQ